MLQKVSSSLHRLTLIGFNQTKNTWASYYLKNVTTINFPLSRMFLLLVCCIQFNTTENLSKWGNKVSNLIINNYSQIPILVSQPTRRSFEPKVDFSRLTKEVERLTKLKWHHKSNYKFNDNKKVFTFSRTKFYKSSLKIPKVWLFRLG